MRHALLRVFQKSRPLLTMSLNRFLCRLNITYCLLGEQAASQQCSQLATCKGVILVV